MNTKISLLGLIEILAALSIGIFILAITYQAVRVYGRRRYDIQSNNLAYSLFTASILFSIGYLVSGVVQPLISLFRLLAARENDAIDLALSFIGTGAIYIALAFVCGVIVVVSGIAIYTFLTPIDEFRELKNNNIGVAVIVGIIIITLSMMARDGVSLLIESLIPYPEQFPGAG
jgi:uncharacterized membrane protein YjfL (UPF0719 family)